jgi:hypothetical protein
MIGSGFPLLDVDGDGVPVLAPFGVLPDVPFPARCFVVGCAASFRVLGGAMETGRGMRFWM